MAQCFDRMLDIMRRAQTTADAATAPAYAAAAPVSSARGAGMEEARGRFAVEIKPASAAGAPVTRMSLEKR